MSLVYGSPEGQVRKSSSKSDQNKYFLSCVKCSHLIGHKMPLVVKMNITKTQINFFLLLKLSLAGLFYLTCFHKL